MIVVGVLVQVSVFLSYFYVCLCLFVVLRKSTIGTGKTQLTVSCPYCYCRTTVVLPTAYLVSRMPGGVGAGDLPAIKCGVCEALVGRLHEKVAEMRDAAPFGKVR